MFRSGPILEMVSACEEKRGYPFRKKVFEIELPGTRKMGRPKRRFMGAFTDGMRKDGVNERDVQAKTNGEGKSAVRPGAAERLEATPRFDSYYPISISPNPKVFNTIQNNAKIAKKQSFLSYL